MDTYDIPIGNLPEGVILCLKNSDRHREDAKILEEKQRYPSAIAEIFVSIEEFAKALFLTSHIMKTKDVEHKDGKIYFTQHLPKLELFFDFLKTIDNYEQKTGKNTWVTNVVCRL